MTIVGVPQLRLFCYTVHSSVELSFLYHRWHSSQGAVCLSVHTVYYHKGGSLISVV